MSKPVSPTLLTPRDWQAIALREAAILSGTPEGAAKLVESNRYGALAARIEQLERENATLKENINAMQRRVHGANRA